MIELLYPQFLFLILIPLIIFFFSKPIKNHEIIALKVPFFEHLKTLTQQTKEPGLSHISRRKTFYFLYFIWILLTLGLTQPIILGHPIETHLNGRNIILALDLSGSMSIQDMEWQGQPSSRLNIVKKTALQFINHRKGDRIGLVVFGTQAFLDTPLTFDHPSLISMLNDTTVGLAGSQTAIGDALGIALKQLHSSANTTESKGEKPSGVIILLTDGGNNAGHIAPLEAAEIAKLEHVKIYTIGLGSAELVVPGPLGPEVIQSRNDMDEETLKTIAAKTGGIFFRAENTSDLQQVYQSLNQIMPIKNSIVQYATKIPLYPYLLVLAMLFLFLFLSFNALNNKNAIKLKKFGEDHEYP